MLLHELRSQSLGVTKSTHCLHGAPALDVRAGDIDEETRLSFGRELRDVNARGCIQRLACVTELDRHRNAVHTNAGRSELRMEVIATLAHFLRRLISSAEMLPSRLSIVVSCRPHCQRKVQRAP